MLFCLHNSPKPEYIELIIMQDKEKQHIPTIEKLYLGNLEHFCLKNNLG